MKMKKSLIPFLFGAILCALPCLVIAQGNTAVSVPSDLSGIDFTSMISTLASSLASAIVAALGIAAGCWGVLLIWRKIRSAGK
ncbi:MAG: hypothetical protein Q4C96_11010 [Planctomycetia bacterium]|nr:hypothetical protein [Planctomycetia bacterium]